jgi:hypothetical protein
MRFNVFRGFRVPVIGFAAVTVLDHHLEKRVSGSGCCSRVQPVSLVQSFIELTFRKFRLLGIRIWRVFFFKLSSRCTVSGLGFWFTPLIKFTFWPVLRLGFTF